MMAGVTTTVVGEWMLRASLVVGCFSEPGVGDYGPWRATGEERSTRAASADVIGLFGVST